MNTISLNRIIILTKLFLSTAAFLNSQSLRVDAYLAFISGNRTAWLAVIKRHENQKLLHLYHKLERIELYYVYTGFLLSDRKYTEAEKYIDKADLLINNILTTEPLNPTALAFKGSFTGFKIPLNRFKLFYLGNESFRYLNLAYQTDPQNLQVLTDFGSALYYTPRIFGGDKRLAIRHFKKALQIIETSDTTLHNWRYLNLLTLLATSYEKTNQVKNADMIYRKILKIEPLYLRVKNELYPSFLKSQMK